MATLADSLLLLACGRREEAAAEARAQAEQQPAPGLASALADYLEGPGRGEVYVDPAGFQAFVDGGGNPALYAAVERELTAIHRDSRPAQVLDVGCGDGRLSTCALAGAPARIDLVDPAAALLEQAAARLAGGGVQVHTHASGIAELLGGERGEGPWHLVQSTFALHTLTPAERRDVLAQLADRARRIVLAEFDVPAFADRSREHAAYCAERYARGIREYADAPAAVDGFLLPVLVGQFAPDAVRHTFEQPAAAWVGDLQRAGFVRACARTIHDYWWGPCVLVEAIAA